jgi:hypothetical protein
LAKSQLRVWAVKGAEQRLLELAREAGEIFAAFPELRGRAKQFDAPGGATHASAARATVGTTPARKRRKRSAEARKRMSDAQKARWARRRAEQGAGKDAARPATAARKKR